MASELPLRCTCGALRGVAHDVGRRQGNRLVCYCRDCQAFAWLLERADELLDAHGGTEVVQVAPARVRFTQGREQLACVRLSANGLLRWYTSCCNTPIANTMVNPKFPFVGLLSSCWDPELDAPARDALLGSLRARVNGPGHADKNGTMAVINKAPIGTIVHSIRVIGRAWLRGEHHPTPFFDLVAGTPSVTPRVLDEAERSALEDRVPRA